jgi:hypothetical protein
MEHLGLSFYGPGVDFTAEGNFQADIRFHLSGNESANKTLFTVYGKASGRPCQAKESALIHALMYIDEVLGYNIVDFNYVKYQRLCAPANAQV